MTQSEGRCGANMSELDKALTALEAKRAQEDAERLARRKLGCDFLASFYENDVKPSRKLAARGVEAWFEGGRLVLQRPDEGDFAEALLIVVGEQGEIDVGGKSLGRFLPGEEMAKKQALITEIIAHFSF
jgi:hypothetical protein